MMFVNPAMEMVIDRTMINADTIALRVGADFMPLNIGSFSKRAKSAILDTLISVFASVLLMILSVFLYTKTPVYQEEYEQISQSMNQITELVSESRLNEGILNEDGTYTLIVRKVEEE